MELPDDIYEQIEILSASGNDACDDEDYDVAIVQWRKALDLLPEPRAQWEAFMWLNASIGDAYYQLGDYEAAQASLTEALETPDGKESGFVYYMLGKTYLSTDDERASDALLRAYQIEGRDIFDSDEDEGEGSLKVLQDQGLIQSH